MYSLTIIFEIPEEYKKDPKNFSTVIKYFAVDAFVFKFSV